MGWKSQPHTSCHDMVGQVGKDRVATQDWNDVQRLVHGTGLMLGEMWS